MSKVILKQTPNTSRPLAHLLLRAIGVSLGCAFVSLGGHATIAEQTTASAPARHPTAGSHGQRPGTKTQPGAKKKPGEDATGPAAPAQTAYDFRLPGADGKDIPLRNFKGKYILLVNLARRSSYDQQLAAIIKLNDTYKDKGWVVIGVPSNDFGAEEPGTNGEIQKDYTDAKVDFPVVSVSKVSGEEQLPIYEYLTKSKGAPPGGPVHWNFTKFIIDTKGKVIARLSPDVEPDSAEMLSTIDQIVSGTYKPESDNKDGAPPDKSARDEED